MTAGLTGVRSFWKQEGGSCWGRGSATESIPKQVSENLRELPRVAARCAVAMGRSCMWALGPMPRPHPRGRNSCRHCRAARPEGTLRRRLPRALCRPPGQTRDTADVHLSPVLLWEPRGILSPPRTRHNLGSAT